MSKLSASDWSRYREVLLKHDRREAEFRLSEEHLRMSDDGTPEGTLWVIHVRTGRGLTFQLGKLRSNWLDYFEQLVQQDVFPRDP